MSELQTTTTVNVIQMSADQITATYLTLPGNQPVAYGNFATWWQGTQIVPWEQGIINPTATPSSNTQVGTLVMAGAFEITPTIVGWGVGPGIENVVATCSLPSPNDQPVVFEPELKITAVTTDSVICSYRMPVGCDPGGYGHSVGLWPGLVARYTTPPIAMTSVTGNSSEGSAVMSAQLERGATYTAGYIAGREQTCLAATAQLAL